MKIDRDLLKKYNVPTPRYTSYPPANFFKSDFEYEKVIESLVKSNSLEPSNVSLYIHIPFCSQLCYYCGCNTYISKDQNLINNYIETLIKEILIYRKYIGEGRRVSQIHWGGGTPNYLKIEDIQRLMKIVFDNFEFIQNPEIAIECHPTHLDFEYLDGLKKAGFNRISLGIQDLKTDVLNKVNRALPNMDLNETIAYIKKQGFTLNLDFMYGLPGQNAESYRETMNAATKFGADRLAIFSYAHVPWVKPHQKLLEKYTIPNAEQKIEMFEIAYAELTKENYVSIGLDHFAKPDDELSIALKNRTLHRNFQGYCTRRTTGQVYAFGVSGISQLATGFFQNTKDLKKYIDSINERKLPIEKSYFLNNNERIIGEIITEIMCNKHIDFNDFAKTKGKTVDDIFKLTQIDFKKIEEFEKEELLTFEDNVLKINQKGQFFLRNIATSFDPLIKATDKKFSKSI